MRGGRRGGLWREEELASSGTGSERAQGRERSLRGPLREPGAPGVNDRSRAPAKGGACRREGRVLRNVPVLGSEDPFLRQPGDLLLREPEQVLEHRSGVLPQERRGQAVPHRRPREPERGADQPHGPDRGVVHLHLHPPRACLGGGKNLVHRVDGPRGDPFLPQFADPEVALPGGKQRLQDRDQIRPVPDPLRVRGKPRVRCKLGPFRDLAQVFPLLVVSHPHRYIAVGVGNDKQWKNLCEIAERPELASDPRFSTNPERVRNRADLIPILEALFSSRESDFWIRELWKEGIPAGPINTLDQGFSAPQTRARGMEVEMDHPSIGTVRLIGSPLRFSRPPVRYRLPPPLLGEHTASVLKDLLGLTEEEIARLS